MLRSYILDYYLKERTQDLIGHDLWKKYNVISLLSMIRYIYTVDSYWCIVGF